MMTADEYRSKAEECERMAREGDAALHAMYLAHAAQWRTLAEQTELLKTQAQKRFVIQNGCPEVVEAMDKEDISIATAVKLAGLPHADQIKCLLEAKLHHFLHGDGDKPTS